MGCCLSSESNQGRSVTGGKPFKRSNIQWTSEVPITRSRLEEKRSTFWETAPFYEGRPEIWQAIQAAMTSEDIILAQSILDAANIKLPTGNPNDGVYDELGNRYEIPLYCIVDPTNVISEEAEDDEIDLGQRPQQQCRQHNESVQSITTYTHDRDSQPCVMTSSSILPLSQQVRSSQGHQKSISNVSSMVETTPSLATHMNSSTNTANTPSSNDPSLVPGDLCITVRLSTGKDIPIKISSTLETVPLLKSRIFEEAHLTTDTHYLRLIYLGKILDDHTSIIADFTLTSTPPLESNTVKLRSGVVIQALVIAKES